MTAHLAGVDGYLLDLGNDVDARVSTAYAEMYISSSAETTLAQTPTYTKIAGTYADGYLSDFTHSNGTLTFAAPATQRFLVSAQVSGDSDATDTFLFKVSVSGTVLANTEARRRISGALDIGSVSIVGVIELTMNDTIEIHASREGGSANITALVMNVTLTAIN